MTDIVLLALAAALNPTLVAASTLMMLLPNPKRLMLGYLLGALTTSITLGLVIVFSLEGSDAIGPTKNTLSPAATAALGGIALAAAFVLGTGRHRLSSSAGEHAGTIKVRRGGNVRWGGARHAPRSSSMRS